MWDRCRWSSIFVETVWSKNHEFCTSLVPVGGSAFSLGKTAVGTYRIFHTARAEGILLSVLPRLQFPGHPQSRGTRTLTLVVRRCRRSSRVALIRDLSKPVTGSSKAYRGSLM